MEGLAFICLWPAASPSVTQLCCCLHWAENMRLWKHNHFNNHNNQLFGSSPSHCFQPVLHVRSQSAQRMSSTRCCILLSKSNHLHLFYWRALLEFFILPCPLSIHACITADTGHTAHWTLQTLSLQSTWRVDLAAILWLLNPNIHPHGLLWSDTRAAFQGSIRQGILPV